MKHKTLTEMNNAQQDFLMDALQAAHVGDPERLSELQTEMFTETLLFIAKSGESTGGSAMVAEKALQILRIEPDL